ncbi:AarF/UbiB family protein [Micromonospora sp. WMMD1120]|uniref:ABC1 kinase family protein n=1 Tax=Micromonospora sp. WMMD1120 TaxID=3016106 RepID=UPI00241773CC|nr:AarF/UbiB family protein [Micromonospora sp. WMMD1120]MDG4810813.1 AarF/UbiB family protein [Micromonospora sp. WMMD1120]
MTLVGQIGLFVLGDIAFVLLYTALAVGARRLLGLRVRTLRTVVAATVGWLSSVMFVQLVSPSGLRGAMITIVLGLSLFTTMIFLVIAEVLLPNGLRPLTWSRDLRGRLARIRRYQQVGAIIMRHRLSRLFMSMRTGDQLTTAQRQERAASLRAALEECGVTSVKLGQTLSARHDLLPNEYIVELSKLHDNVPPSDWEDVRAILTEDLGAPPEDIFAEFDTTPIAAASIAQVHRATLQCGTRVAVKVRRPGIEIAAENDLSIVRRLAKTLEARTDWGRRVGAMALAEGFSTALREELDFRTEARNITTIAAAIRARHRRPRVRPPSVVEPYCTTRVLVMEYLDGVPVGSATGILSDPTVDRRALATDLMTSVLEQILLDGTFHCDPHPGNVLVLPDGGLGLLDYGVVGRLDPMMQDSVQQLLLAIDRNDRAGATDALLEILTQTGDIDKQRLERAVGQFITRHVALGNAGLDMITELMRLVTGYGLSVPPEAAAMFRTLATLQGTLNRLDPSFDLFEESRAFASRQHIRFRAVADAAQGVGEDMMAILPLLRRLPRRLDRITTALEQGQFRMSVSLFAHERDRRHITSLVHQTLLAFLAAATGVIAAMLLGNSGGPQVTTDISLFSVFGYNLLIVSVVLMLRTLVKIFRRES